jgi:hypothetical protein
MIPLLVQVLNLPASVRYHRDFLFCAGVMQHKKKFDLNVNLVPLFAELCYLGEANGGIEVKRKTSTSTHVRFDKVRVLTHAFVMDSVGMGEVCGTKAPRGNFGCGFCNVEGKHARNASNKGAESTSYFPIETTKNTRLRSPGLIASSFFGSSGDSAFGQKIIPFSAFLPCSPFPIAFACYDKFHGQANAQKKIVKTIIEGIKSVIRNEKGENVTQYMGGLSPAQRAVISARMNHIRVPHTFGRTPRDVIANWGNYIGEEWGALAQIYFRIAFFGLPGGLSHGNRSDLCNINGINMYYAATSLFVAHTYLNRHSVSSKGIKKATKRIKAALDCFSEISIKLMVISMHGQLHSGESTNMFGPGIDMYLFERYMPILKGDTRSRLHVESGIVNRLIGKALLQNLLSDSSESLHNLIQSCQQELDTSQAKSGRAGAKDVFRTRPADSYICTHGLISASTLTLDIGKYFVDMKLPDDAAAALVHDIDFMTQTEDLHWVRRKIRQLTHRPAELLYVSFFGRLFACDDAPYINSGKNMIGEKERFSKNASVVISALGHKLRFNSNPKLDELRTSHIYSIRILNPSTGVEEDLPAEIICFTFAKYNDEVSLEKKRTRRQAFRGNVTSSETSAGSSVANSCSTSNESESCSTSNESESSEQGSTHPKNCATVVKPIEGHNMEDRVFVIVRYCKPLIFPHHQALTKHTPSVNDTRLDELLEYLQKHLTEIADSSKRPPATFFQDKQTMIASLKAAKRFKVPLIPFSVVQRPRNHFSPHADTAQEKDSWDVLPLSCVGDALCSLPIGCNVNQAAQAPSNQSRTRGLYGYGMKEFVALSPSFPKAVSHTKALQQLKTGSF